jgi:hypothetical protein
VLFIFGFQLSGRSLVSCMCTRASQSAVPGLNAESWLCYVISVQIMVCNILSAQMSSSTLDGLVDLVVPALI